jgi:hypothetical protein
VGVLPPSFDFSSIFAPGSSMDIVEPFPICAETDGLGNTLSVIGRLKPGVSMTAAQAEFNLINQRLEHEHPERGKEFAARMTPLPQKINGQFQRPFLLLLGAVGCVLLIACATCRTSFWRGAWRDGKNLRSESRWARAVSGSSASC